MSDQRFAVRTGRFVPEEKSRQALYDVNSPKAGEINEMSQEKWMNFSKIGRGPNEHGHPWEIPSRSIENAFCVLVHVSSMLGFHYLISFVAEHSGARILRESDNIKRANIFSKLGK